ncbi:MAG: hypothetical protein E7396_00940 [Ruminococcaceae bacterium]|nr:hypothetical protein [Oscillospiraceae bacterium]
MYNLSDNICVNIIDMPTVIKGFTKLCDYDFYNIYINAKYSLEEQKKILKHELNHIRSNHFHSDKYVEECEKEADE